MKGSAKILLIIGGIALALFGLGILLVGGGQQTISSEQKSTVLGANSHQIQGGSKVTLVEFGDFECPACGAANPVVQKILKEYQGKITYAFRHFPIPSHKTEPIAAEAAEAAGEQGKFFEMVDLLYTNQKMWVENSNALNIFVGYAHDLGLDTNKFKQEVESKKFAAKISQDSKDGSSLGVNSTPTFFLNEVKFTGAPSYTDLKQKIDAALSAS